MLRRFLNRFARTAFLFGTFQYLSLSVAHAIDLGIEVNDHTYFYRFMASYEVDGEPLEFNIVVACSVRVTTYGDNSSSFDAFRYPTNYVKRTKSGGALWQYVTDACDGATSESGEVPADFMPGAIYFKDSEDLSLGTGYFTEDAFENETSPIKFLGATIERATRKEFEVYRPELAKNLIEPAEFTLPSSPPSAEEVGESPWDRTKWMSWSLSTLQCFGVQRIQLTDPEVRSALAKLQPPGATFWRPAKGELEKELGGASNENLGLQDHSSRDAKKYIQLEGQLGFPTRAGGGRMYYQGRVGDVYPYRQSDAVPWFGPDLLKSDATVYKDVDMNSQNKGLSLCYIAMFPNSWFTRAYIPDYEKRSFVTRINGETLMQKRDPARSVLMPGLFFENYDAVFYQHIISFH